MYGLAFLLCLAAVVDAQVDYTQHVRPFLGTAGGGNMFPGVARPFGMAKLGPDVYNGADAYSGYLPTGDVNGYSMMHVSGTGGAPKYGTVSQFPVVGKISNPLSSPSSSRASADQAEVGYYKSTLSTGITVELAASDRSGLYQYTFPTGKQGTIVVDVSHVLPSFRGQGLGQKYSKGSISILQDGHYEGSGTYNNGWNRSPDWTVYFCGRFDQAAAESKTFGEGNAVPSNPRSASGTGRLGATFTFNQKTVKSRVGISWISAAKACQTLGSEIPANTQLQSLVKATQKRWNDQVLSKITTTETNPTNLQLLYTALYGMHLMPTNRTGENPKWQSSEPYYDDIVTYWDLFRSQTPLMHILQPAAYEEQIRSLIDIWRRDGYLPDGRSSNFNGRTQGGSNADNVLADAYVKGVRGKVNWADGYKAMVKDAEVTPANNNDPMARDSSTKEGRGALPDWKSKGFISTSYSRAVSRAVEYAGNDFALHQVARLRGETQDAGKYLAASRNWRNHWDPKATALGFSGFLVPKSPTGVFSTQNPLSCGGCYWGDAYYQGLPWEYSFTALHDMKTIVQLSGGAAKFVSRLDTSFKPNQHPNGDARFDKTIFNPGNEPDFAMPYLYNFAGRQDLSVERSRFVAKSYYNTGASGLPGNSDAGAMQSWLLWNMIGLYPLTGQTTFLIASPWFRSMTINLGGGKKLTVTSTGPNSTTANKVQSLKVNGQTWNKSWLVWSDVFANGGTMAFVLGEQRKDWATGALPPSPAS
ncbi:MAG: hypothetical protein M1837_005456 [Sclerophora amabilis]|nr:MAG: hypothetical protein M1837_005456 [Sclerophora amabilis]